MNHFLFYFLYALLDLFGSYLLLCYLRFFNHYLIKNKKIELVSYLIFYSFCLLAAVLVKSAAMLMMFNIIIWFFLTLNYKTSITKKLFSLIITFSIFYSSENIIAFAYDISMDKVTIDLPMTLYSKLLQWMIWIVIKKYLDASAALKKSNIQWYFFVLFSLMMLVVECIVQQESFHLSQMILTVILTLSIIISLISIYKLDQERLKSEIELSEQKIENYKQQYSQLRNSYLAYNLFRHKLAKHFRNIYEKISDRYGEDEQLRSYFDRILMEAMETDKHLIETDNLELDSVINAKLREAEENGIETTYKILIPDHMEVNVADTCDVINRVFDAVIKEIDRMKKKKLHFVMRYDATYLYIYWVCPYDSTIEGMESRQKYLLRNKSLIEKGREVLEKYYGDMDCVFYDKKKSVIWDASMYAGEI